MSPFHQKCEKHRFLSLIENIGSFVKLSFFIGARVIGKVLKTRPKLLSSLWI